MDSVRVMWDLLIGPIVGALTTLAAIFLTKRGQRKLWRLQEAIKAYADFFPAAEKELSVCESLSYGGAMGDDEMIRRASDMFPARTESPLEALTKPMQKEV